MEHLHTLINGIDNVKEHLTDHEYILLMSAISKLNEIISENDNNTSYSSDDIDDIDENNIESYDIIDIDLFLDIIDNNESILMNFIKEKNLSNDFINSKFNIIHKSAYNCVIQKTCNCKDKFEVCINNTMNCRNYQNFIINNPINYLINERFNNDNYPFIVEDIKKYNMFLVTGQINKNETNIDDRTTVCNTKIMLEISELLDSNYKVLNFINLINYIFNNCYKQYILNDNFRKTLYNKLITDGNCDTLKQHLPFWANLFNFDLNIINIMTNNLTDQFKELL